MNSLIMHITDSSLGKKDTNFNLIWLFGIASRINVSIFVYLFTSSMRSTYVLLARDQTNKLIYSIINRNLFTQAISYFISRSTVPKHSSTTMITPLILIQKAFAFYYDRFDDTSLIQNFCLLCLVTHIHVCIFAFN